MAAARYAIPSPEALGAEPVPAKQSAHATARAEFYAAAVAAGMDNTIARMLIAHYTAHGRRNDDPVAWTRVKISPLARRKKRRKTRDTVARFFAPECSICMDGATPTRYFEKCRHACLCATCSYSSCPLCRMPAEPDNRIVPV